MAMAVTKTIGALSSRFVLPNFTTLGRLGFILAVLVSSKKEGVIVIEL